MSDTETYTARCPRCHQDADWTAVRHTADGRHTDHDHRARLPCTDPRLKGPAMFGKYTKAILGTLAALATWGVTAGADGTYSQVELWGLLGVIAAALTVAGVANATAKDDGASAADLCLVVIAAGVAVLALVALFGRP